jgi:hypothetical protein
MCRSNDEIDRLACLNNCELRATLKLYRDVPGPSNVDWAYLIGQALLRGALL